MALPLSSLHPNLYRSFLWNAIQMIVLALAFFAAPHQPSGITTFRIIQELFDADALGLLCLLGGGLSLAGLKVTGRELLIAGTSVQFATLILLLLLLVFWTLRGLDGEFAFSALFIGLIGPAAIHRLTLLSELGKVRE